MFYVFMSLLLWINSYHTLNPICNLTFRLADSPSSLDTQTNQFIQSAKIMLFTAKCDCWGLMRWSKNNLYRLFDTLVNNEICNTDLPIFLTNPVSASSASHIWQWKQSGCHDVFIALITRPITNSPHLLQHGA